LNKGKIDEFDFEKHHHSFGRHKGNYRFCVRYDFQSNEERQAFETFIAKTTVHSKCSGGKFNA